MGFTDKEGNAESKYYTVTDIQGSVIEVYDSDSKLVWKSGYTAFGIKAGETTKLLDFDGLYTGCDYDAETGLSYHWNRWRSEDGEFWLTQDPIRDGMNWYGYAGCNPVNNVDLNGLQSIYLPGGGTSFNGNCPGMKYNMNTYTKECKAISDFVYRGKNMLWIQKFFMIN